MRPSAITHRLRSGTRHRARIRNGGRDPNIRAPWRSAASAPAAPSWHGRALFVSETLRGEDLGLEEVAEGLWNPVYYRTLLGRIDVRSGHVTGL